MKMMAYSHIYQMPFVSVAKSSVGFQSFALLIEFLLAMIGRSLKTERQTLMVLRSLKSRMDCGHSSQLKLAERAPSLSFRQIRTTTSLQILVLYILTVRIARKHFCSSYSNRSSLFSLSTLANNTLPYTTLQSTLYHTHFSLFFFREAKKNRPRGKKTPRRQKVSESCQTRSLACFHCSFNFHDI